MTPASAAGTAQSIVRQASDQRQHGVLPLKTQRQRSTQASSTIQSVRLSRKLIRNPQSATISAAPIESAVNQTVQRIWQLQIGCLSHCAHTVQYQQAKQTSTTVQQLVAPLATAAAAQDNTYQSIWQLQVGCLVWCFSATEQQRAASRHLTLSSPTAQSPPEVGRSGFVQLESTIASQSEEPGVGIVAGSVQASGVSALRSSGGRSHHRHVSVAHPPRRPRSSATVPQPSVVRSSVANRRTDSSYAVLGVVAGLIALLAMISASRVVPRRARR